MKLHLGCWHRNFPGFVNVDLCDMPHIHFNSSIDKLPFIENESVDYIYCSHAFEYFDLEKAQDVLFEWKRVLKPGGILRIAVPDFDKLLIVYQKTQDIKRVLGPLFGRMMIKDKNNEVCLFHKTVYNYQLIVEILSTQGFVEINRYDWRETEHSMFDDHSQAYFPHLDKENGLLISLNVEAKKANDE
jgi:predicted SAM-dependent methyltransferase